MSLRFFCTKWGQKALSWPAFLAQAKATGYDGVEVNMPTDLAERHQLLAGLHQHGLLFIGQHWETVTDASLQTRIRTLTLL